MGRKLGKGELRADIGTLGDLLKVRSFDKPLAVADGSLARRGTATSSSDGHDISSSDPVNAVAASMLAEPQLLFDYFGFPPDSYGASCDGFQAAPDVARRALKLLREAAGANTWEDHGRGWDHGVFVPLLAMKPGFDSLCRPATMSPASKGPPLPLSGVECDTSIEGSGLDEGEGRRLPSVAVLSLHPGLDGADHLRMGAALAPLREQGVLIVGSGSTGHNLAEGMPRLSGRGRGRGRETGFHSIPPDPTPIDHMSVLPWAAAFELWVQDKFERMVAGEQSESASVAAVDAAAAARELASW